MEEKKKRKEEKKGRLYKGKPENMGEVVRIVEETEIRKVVEGRDESPGEKKGSVRKHGK